MTASNSPHVLTREQERESYRQPLECVRGPLDGAFLSGVEVGAETAPFRGGKYVRDGDEYRWVWEQDFK